MKKVFKVLLTIAIVIIIGRLMGSCAYMLKHR